MVRRGKTFKNKTALSIPELKHAWDEIHKSTHDILKEGKPAPQQIKDFQKMWKKIFHRPVSSESAGSYLNIMRLSSSRRMGRKTRKMKGGAMPIAGAPIDSTLQPGVYGTHGSFPSYQSAGLGFYDTINKQGIFEECGFKDITPVLGVSVGSNQAGGAIADLFSIAPHSSLIGNKAAVPGVIDNATLAFKGLPTGSASNPDILRD
jgi:hypothetical protein